MKERVRRFVTEYLKDLNGTQAAIRAGYKAESAKAQANQILNRPEVRAEVDRLINERAKRTQVQADEIIYELKKIAFSNMSRVARWGASGVNFKESEELSEEDAGSVQEVHESTNQHGGTLKIKQYDKVRALELLGKHIGMFRERDDDADRDRPLKELSDAELLKMRGDE